MGSFFETQCSYQVVGNFLSKTKAKVKRHPHLKTCRVGGAVTDILYRVTSIFDKYFFSFCVSPPDRHMN